MKTITTLNGQRLEVEAMASNKTIILYGYLTKRITMRKTLPISLFAAIAVAGVVMTSTCNNNPAWLEVTEASLIGDWTPFNYDDAFIYMTLAPDGNNFGGTLWYEYCYWTEWQLFNGDPWHLKGDTLCMKYYSKNASCLDDCEGVTARLLVKVSSNELRTKLVDWILTSGDTIVIKDDDWSAYKRVDASKRKAELKNAVPMMPVFYKDLSLQDGVLWVNSAGNKSLKFWLRDSHSAEVFEYIERNAETGDSVVYTHLDNGRCDAPAWYTTHGANGNRLVLRNATVDGFRSLGNFVFEYSIVTTGFLDVMTMRRIENGEPVGDFETWVRDCNDVICGDGWDEDGLLKRSKMCPFFLMPHKYPPFLRHGIIKGTMQEQWNQ
ncbi:MAG: hypothetical protein LBH93_04185 [Chitinispirillales bacterium]|nr:hypothetical protein [Chitinispirillales bacterium]